MEELKSLKMMNSLNIDAITIHEYIDASLGSVTSSALMTPNEIQTMLNRPFEALNHLKDFEFKKIEEALGSEMEIWMTEFNLFDNNNPGYLTHSTWAHGLFAAAMTLGFLE